MHQYFNGITYEHWLDAIQLIENLYKYKDEGHKFFNKFSIDYHYKNIQINNDIKNKQFFESIIESNLILSEIDKLQNTVITIPKVGSNFNLRKYGMIPTVSYIIYTAIAISYFSKVHNLLNFIKEQENLNQYSGINLQYNEQEKQLIYTKNDLYYYKRYEEYQNKLHEFIIHSQECKDLKQSVIIALDIEHCFENINIQTMNDILIDIIPELQSEKVALKNKAQVLNLLNNHNIYGIPQTDFLIASSIIADIFLSLVSIEVESILNTYLKAYPSQFKFEYSIIRYVDDIHICLQYPSKLMNELCIKIIHKIQDILFSKFNLRLNSKCETLFLDKYEDRHKAHKIINKPSHVDEDINDNEQEQNPHSLIQTCIKQLQKLYKNIDDIYLGKYQCDNIHDLNTIFNSRVQDLCNKPDNKEAIINILDNNSMIAMISYFPKALTCLVFQIKDLKTAYLSKLTEIIEAPEEDGYIKAQISKSRIINLLLATIPNLDDSEIKESILEYLFKLCKFNDESKKLMNIKYYDWITYWINKKNQSENINHNIIQYGIAKSKKDYTICINHLVNIIESVCSICSPNTNQKNYLNQTEIINILQNKSIAIKLQIDIKTLYQYRHHNGISHSDNRYVNTIDYSTCNKLEQSVKAICVKLQEDTNN